MRWRNGGSQASFAVNMKPPIAVDRDQPEHPAAPCWAHEARVAKPQPEIVPGSRANRKRARLVHRGRRKGRDAKPIWVTSSTIDSVPSGQLGPGWHRGSADLAARRLLLPGARPAHAACPPASSRHGASRRFVFVRPARHRSAAAGSARPSPMSATARRAPVVTARSDRHQSGSPRCRRRGPNWALLHQAMRVPDRRAPRRSSPIIHAASGQAVTLRGSRAVRAGRGPRPIAEATGAWQQAGQRRHLGGANPAPPPARR